VPGVQVLVPKSPKPSENTVAQVKVEQKRQPTPEARSKPVVPKLCEVW